ncbi:MAG: nicotinate phosphoribosyltransferase [Candidatus Borkfalkiaceae bacterium]|nr:nicotinate phosphoribosyltransferase [Christensenellaceae bacterium]
MQKRNLTLLTDLYELTMMNGYYLHGKQDEIAVFDVFFRQNELITYSLAAGLEQAVDYCLNLNFGENEISYLKSLGIFDDGFLEYLKTLKFTGDIYAVPEGTVVFPGEPIFTVKAPVMQAQLIEAAVLNIINHQTLIASKAAKVCAAAKGDNVMEFGLRRAQGPDAGIYGARAAIIGGCSSTSNVLAGQMFGVKVSGTHAHSWVMDFPSEYEAFRAYSETYPDATLLLVDTYDTLKSGIPNAIKVFDELKAKGKRPLGIRIDSGDLAYTTKRAREMLDEAGYPDAIICASGDLDERLVQSLKQQGAKINSWGIGTKLITSADMPALGGVYKLAGIEKDGKIIPKIKVSDNSAKITNPGFKTIYRIYDKKTGKAEADLIALRDEKFDFTKPITLTHPTERWKTITFTDYIARELPIKAVENGKLAYNTPSIKEIADYARKETETFWDEYKRLDQPHIFKVDLSDGLYALKTDMLARIRKGERL